MAKKKDSIEKAFDLFFKEMDRTTQMMFDDQKGTDKQLKKVDSALKKINQAIDKTKAKSK